MLINSWAVYLSFSDILLHGFIRFNEQFNATANKKKMFSFFFFQFVENFQFFQMLSFWKVLSFFCVYEVSFTGIDKYKLYDHHYVIELSLLNEVSLIIVNTLLILACLHWWWFNAAIVVIRMSNARHLLNSHLFMQIFLKGCNKFLMNFI